ncbi:hypothetical protein BJL95_00820 [Methylomonas sp. LWB]|uniref:cell envelope integrity protein TolA n=1 Tax=Methylomonas sp. LWB TaxID=1905845 RepID=UPI0008D9079D|nr:cell envelope integrity protein TolA [Methylomonas sp. LWB]OHX35333.1 hypothetical protein BJL95_00820 [Methylomonas sp. LWB]
MPNEQSELDAWLTGADLADGDPADAMPWVADFDPDRQMVLRRLGPYQKYYPRPKRFIKRFYHRLYPLAIAYWPQRKQIKLFDEFCTLDLRLELRFQATFDYAMKNLDRLEHLNEHIKQRYADIVEDVVQRELTNLADGAWIQNGLNAVEARMALALAETFVQQSLQAQAMCRIDVEFSEFESVKLGRDSVYLNVLRKTYEFNRDRTLELARQQRLLEQEEIAERRRQLEHLAQTAELDLQAQAIEADKQCRLLAAQQDQLAEQLALEKRLQAERLRHEMELQEMRQEAELRSQEKQAARRRLAESLHLADQLAHQAAQHEKQVAADIQRRLREQHLRQTSLLNDEGLNYDNQTE